MAVQADLDKVDFNDMWVSPKLDGCFSATTMIWTEDGLIPIGVIVDSELSVKVASYNETTKEVEFKPVVGWFNNGLKIGPEWMSFSSKRKVTKNHEVFTESGWEPAISAEGVGLHVDPNLSAVITGMLLGDSIASIEKRGASSSYVAWRMAWSNCRADVEYGRRKASLLSPWLKIKEKEYTSGYGFPQINFTTSVCRPLPYDLSRFYTTDPQQENFGRRKKDLSLCDIQEGFTDLSLAIWYFDDGSLQSNNGNNNTPKIHFSVARYSEATLTAFMDLFRVKYGITPTIKAYGNDIKMSFSSADSVYLLWRMGKSAGGLMPRKMIDGTMRTIPKVSKEPVWLPSLVGKPFAETSLKKWAAYDIEVQDNHNYFAEGQLVHNCRGVVIDGVVMSRNLKPIPNKHVQKLFGHLEYYDGELIAGSPTSPSVYRDTASAVMSVDGEPDVTFYVFDHIEFPGDDYALRYRRLQADTSTEVLAQNRIDSLKTLSAWEDYYLEQGYEGVMLRKSTGPNSKYKFGRATAKSQTLLKVKRFVDAEYEIIGFEERMHNGNLATTDALGHTKRSSHKENKTGRGDLGALICVTKDGIEFSVGSGFTDEQRAEIWANRAKYLGKLAKIKSFPIGVKTAPRFPVFLGFRSEIDL